MGGTLSNWSSKPIGDSDSGENGGLDEAAERGGARHGGSDVRDPWTAERNVQRIASQSGNNGRLAVGSGGKYGEDLVKVGSGTESTDCCRRRWPSFQEKYRRLTDIGAYSECGYRQQWICHRNVHCSGERMRQ